MTDLPRRALVMGGERFRRLPRHPQARRARRRRAGVPAQEQFDRRHRRPRRRTLLRRPLRRRRASRGDGRPRCRLLLRRRHPLPPARPGAAVRDQRQLPAARPRRRGDGGPAPVRVLQHDRHDRAGRRPRTGHRGHAVRLGGDKGGPYIESRRQAEDLVLSYARDRGLPAVAMCVSNPYGPATGSRIRA